VSEILAAQVMIFVVVCAGLKGRHMPAGVQPSERAASKPPRWQRNGRSL